MFRSLTIILEKLKICLTNDEARIFQLIDLKNLYALPFTLKG